MTDTDFSPLNLVDRNNVTVVDLADSDNATARDAELESYADEVAASLLSADPHDVSARASSRASLEGLGSEPQQRAAAITKMLDQPLRALARDSQDGGSVATALIELKLHVERLDPARIDFSPGWFSQLLGYLPFVGTPVKRYLSRFESGRKSIDAVVRSIESSRDQLKRDNITLLDDQKQLQAVNVKLVQAVKLASMIDHRIEDALSSEGSQEKARFMREELLFPLRQRTIDLQQQLAVNQQAILAIEIVVRNNKELIRGVERAQDVTVNALKVAVTVAMAAENQKQVIDKVNALGETTSQILSSTAQRLKTQGVEIHKMASSAMLDITALKTSFEDINTALDEISRFRQEALPQLKEALAEIDEVNVRSSTLLARIEERRGAEPAISLSDVLSDPDENL